MDKKTINTYNATAKEYDEETADFWEKFPTTFIDAFKKEIKGKVLDVGSGSGRDALILEKAGLNVICLDASQVMINLTEQKGLKSVLADFNHIPFTDESFGGVWAYTSLLHVPKSEIIEPLREIRRVLKNGGILGLGLIKGDTEGYRESFGVNLPRFFAYYTKKEIEKNLRDAGFEIFYFETFKPKTKNYLHFLARKLG